MGLRALRFAETEMGNKEEDGRGRIKDERTERRIKG